VRTAACLRLATVFADVARLSKIYLYFLLLLIMCVLLDDY
jgi:hypothetical protein